MKIKFKRKTSKELSEWSHNFTGWQKTTDGQIIDYNKYIKDFNLDEGW